jgi:LPXTG-site transpeptidase (sortase) family protein
VLQTAEGPMRFVVDSTAIVKPSDTQVLLPAPHRDLTLVTCYPFYYVGNAPKRFIVHATREPA